MNISKTVSSKVEWQLSNNEIAKILYEWAKQKGLSGDIYVNVVANPEVHAVISIHTIEKRINRETEIFEETK